MQTQDVLFVPYLNVTFAYLSSLQVIATVNLQVHELIVKR